MVIWSSGEGERTLQGKELWKDVTGEKQVKLGTTGDKEEFKKGRVRDCLTQRWGMECKSFKVVTNCSEWREDRVSKRKVGYKDLDVEGGVGWMQDTIGPVKANP